jgi:hypothetical protein
LDRGVRWLTGGIGFLALIFTALFLIPFSPAMPEAGLDASWRYALNEAVAEGQVFGQGVIFTFGPLGSVFTGTFHPATDTIMMVGSTLYAAGLCIAFALLAHPRRHAFAIFLVAAVCLTSRDAGFLVLPFALLLAILRLTLPPGSSLQLRATPLILLGIAISTSAVAMEPLIKGSFTGVALPLGGLALFLLLTWNWRAGLGFALIALATLIAGWGLAGQPLAQLPRFFIAQGPIISGYTTGMALEHPNGRRSSIWRRALLWQPPSMSMCSSCGAPAGAGGSPLPGSSGFCSSPSRPASCARTRMGPLEPALCCSRDMPFACRRARRPRCRSSGSPLQHGLT